MIALVALALAVHAHAHAHAHAYAHAHAHAHAHASTCVLNTTVPSHVPSAIVSPLHYDLELSLPDPNALASLTFSGTVNGTFLVHSPTSCVVLHGKNLTLGVISLNGVAVAANVTYAADGTDFVILEFGQALPVGQIRVGADFEGVIQDARPGSAGDAFGLFVSANEAPPSAPLDVKQLAARWGRHGRSRGRPSFSGPRASASTSASQYMLATQLEETDARRLWPCMDEPALKATVQVTVRVPISPGSAAVRALGNTECVASVDGQTTVTVCPTTRNPLPTYLIAVAVGEFDVLSTVSRGVTYRIFTPPGLSSWGQHALNCSVHAAEFFGDLLGLPYSDMNTKMDSIAVGGIDMDAMENQGLLTYAPQMLLLNPDGNAMPEVPDGYFGQQILIALVTTHEIAHMWFGDTATLPDWTQMFLNEGFARYLQYVGADDLFKSWDLEDIGPHSRGRAQSFFQFTLEVFLNLDIDGTAPPAVLGLFPLSPLQAEEAAMESFHRMLYEKGAAVNRLAHDFLGAPVWFKALGAYLKTFIWGTPTVDGLLGALDGAMTAAGAGSAAASLGPWLMTPNFPVVTFTQTSNLLTVAQVPASPYTLETPDGNGNGNGNRSWWIPLPVLAGGSRELQFQFSTPSAAFPIPVDGPVLGNVNFTLPYIVRYSDLSTWSDLISTLVNEQATLSLRVLLIHTVMLAQQSHDPLSLPGVVTARLGAFLAAQANLTGDPADLYEAGYAQLGALSARLGGAISCQATVDAASRALTLPLIARLGFAGPEIPGTTVLADTLFWAVRARDTSAQNAALALFQAAASPAALSDTVVAAACFAAAQAGVVTPLLNAFPSAPAGSTLQAALLLAATAGVADSCAAGLALVSAPLDLLQVVQNVLLHSRSTTCRNESLALFTSSVATAVWAAQGATAGTDTLIAAAAASVAGVEIDLLRGWAQTNRAAFSSVQWATLQIKTSVTQDLWLRNDCPN